MQTHAQPWERSRQPVRGRQTESFLEDRELETVEVRQDTGMGSHQLPFPPGLFPGCFSGAITPSPPSASVAWTPSNGSKFKSSHTKKTLGFGSQTEPVNLKGSGATE